MYFEGVSKFTVQSYYYTSCDILTDVYLLIAIFNMFDVLFFLHFFTLALASTFQHLNWIGAYKLF